MMYVIQTEQPGDGIAIESLLKRAFDDALKDKPANTLRRQQRPLRELCFTLWQQRRLAGAVRVWPLAIAQNWPALLLGPIAVDPDTQGHGLGSLLMHHTLDAAAAFGHGLVFLVGDYGYYHRFGFVPAGPMNFDVDLPPCDVRRFLCAELHEGAATGKSGLIAPWRRHRQSLTTTSIPASMTHAA
jgi:predicted N-acetyltransferase YhbS